MSGLGIAEHPYFDDAAASCRDSVRTFRPDGWRLTFEADADYQLLKVILKRGDEKKTLCVMDWEYAYDFGSAISVATVSAKTRGREADAIAEAELADT